MRIKNKYTITCLTVIAVIGAIFFCVRVFREDFSAKKVKVGFIYIGDTSTAYTNNFFRSQLELEDALGSNLEISAKFNVTESDCEKALSELIEEKCNIIFTTSYSYENATKEAAAKHPEIQFCHATGKGTHEEPFLANYHNFMGTIFEGRYISGLVAGKKLLELIENGQVERAHAKIGYVAAFPYPEVISGYTAFFLGVRSIVPETVMSVKYTNTWSNQIIEKKYAEALINEGCVIISQHSDTTGPAIACEEMSSKYKKTVFHVGYNQSMTDVAPTTSLVSCRINWTPYLIAAVKAVLRGKKIEDMIKSQYKANDTGFGFNHGWIEIIGLNKLITAKDSDTDIEKTIKMFKTDSLTVFQGNYIGVNPFDDSDVWDLKTPFPENKTQSAPAFCYVLKDVITIEK